MNCPFCGTANPDDSVFCKKCGRRMSGTVTCPACGAASPADGDFCTHCGARLNAPAPVPAEERPAAWRQILVTVGNALAVFAALASVIFLFCLGCEMRNPLLPTLLWFDWGGTDIYYFFGEIYRDIYDVYTKSVPVFTGVSGYSQAVIGTLLSAGMMISVCILFILTLVRFVRSFGEKKGRSVVAMAAKTYFLYLAFALLFLALHSVTMLDGEARSAVTLNGATIAGLIIGAVGVLSAAVLHAVAGAGKMGRDRILQLSFSGACLLLVAAVFALLSGSIAGITLFESEDNFITLIFGLIMAYRVPAEGWFPSGGGTLYPAASATISTCSILGFLFLIVLFLLLAVLASSLVKGIAEPDETPRTLRYMIPAMILAIGLTVCSALTLGSLATLFQEYAGGSAVTIATQFTLPIIAAVLSALALILLIVYGALTGGKEENKD